MSYRRSRLQDYYEQLLGDKPSNDERDQDEEESSAEPEQDPIFPWLVPQPQPEPEVTSVTPMTNLVPNKPQALESPDLADPSPSESIGQALSSDSGGQGGRGASQTEIRPPATTLPPAILVSPDLLDISEDAVGSLEKHIAALYDGQPVAGSAQPIVQAPTPVTDEFGNTPLTPGKAMHVDHLLAVETDSLAREVLITLKREGLPPISEWNDFMTPYALWSWDAESDALALATLTTIAESDWDEWLGHADSQPAETTAQDLGDNTIEGLVIIDARTGDTLLDRTGVVRADGSQFVGLQDTEVEALQGLELIFVHNHPNGSDASEEDLDSAFRAGAELLIVITPQGQEFVYIRGRYGMVKVRDEKASYEVGPATLRETRALVARSKAQSRVFLADSPESIFLQDQPTPTPYSTPEPLATLSALEVERLLYLWLPLIPDEQAHGRELDIEISDDEWADRTGEDDDHTTQRGILSRDYNHYFTGSNIEDLDEPFQVQSPLMGPDVRVEFVVRDHEELGNYVVISFPALVYQSNDEIMQQLEMQNRAADRLLRQSKELEQQSFAEHITEEERAEMQHRAAEMRRLANKADHNPNRWNEDGRIFYAFAHLSKIEPHIQPGEFIDSRGETIIGETGKSGTSQHHLDLAITYFGSSEPGSGAMERELNILRSEYRRTGSNSADYFFGLAMRSQLDPYTKRFDLYGENLDSARLHPALDERGIAEFVEGYSIYGD